MGHVPGGKIVEAEKQMLRLMRRGGNTAMESAQLLCGRRSVFMHIVSLRERNRRMIWAAYLAKHYISTFMEKSS
ncbi:hypothetical protein D3Z50_01720 [Clostridiaceae bacterium]|nr:hypothetical protein [Clostridiaceae bacterium]